MLSLKSVSIKLIYSEEKMNKRPRPYRFNYRKEEKLRNYMTEYEASRTREELIKV